MGPHLGWQARTSTWGGKKKAATCTVPTNLCADHLQLLEVIYMYNN